MHLKLFDAFISYSRTDSQNFVIELHARLLQQGLKIWVDHHDIPPAVDWQAQIQDGIERSHNFIFVIAPHALESKYCLEELEIAVRLKKRIIPLLHVRVDQDKRPADLRRLNWIYCQDEIDDFDVAFNKLRHAIAQDQDYVEQHTILLIKALRWQQNQQRLDYLLIGEERQQAEAWLKQEFHDHQPPCEPTDWQCEYICESTKNANNFLTDVFISYASQDREVMSQLRRRMMRAGVTIWSDRADIKTGTAFQAAIDQGIEGADNVVYLLSPHSIRSAYCQTELAYAQKLNKRIIPIRLGPIDQQSIPDVIKGIQLIDYFTSPDEASDRNPANNLLQSLHQDSFYYKQSKNLLVKALKWEQQNRNPSILLRGHNLQHYTAWLSVAQSHQDHKPIAIQTEFLKASQAHPPEPSLDVFISYSRADADFARRLNEALQFQGKTTWFDQESIPSGSHYQEEIHQGIQSADNFLFVISPRSIHSPYCDDEVDYANVLGKRILTVLYQPVEVTEVPQRLARIQWVDFTSDRGDFYTKFSELIRNLDVDREHVKNHTKWLLRSREWQEKGKSADLLLRGNELVIAADWLQTAQQEDKQPVAIALQQELIRNSEQAIAAETQREQRRVLVLRSLLGVVSGALAIAIGLGIEAYQEFRRATINEIEAVSRSAEALFASDQQLEAMLAILEAKQNLANLKIQKGPVANYADTVLSKIDYRIIESNRLIGHTQEVFDVALRPDNQLIATASDDKTIKLWRPDGSLVDTLVGHTGPVWSVAFSPNGRTLLSGSADRQIKVWQLDMQRQTYKLVQTLAGHKATVYDLKFHPNGRQFASGSGDSTVKLWELVRPAAIATLQGHTNEVYSVDFSPDGQTLGTGAGDGLIKLWQRAADGQTYVERQTLTGHNGWISKITFSPDGQVLASASADHSLRLWRVKDGNLLHTLNGHTDVVWSVIWDRDSKTLVSGSWDRTLRLWNRDGILLGTLKGHQQRVRDLDVSSDDAFIVSASADETVKIWRRSKTLLTFYRSHAAGVLDVAANADLIATASDDKTVKLWPRVSWRNLLVHPLRTLEGHQNGVLGVAISPDGQLIASGSWDKTVKLWQRDGTLLATLTGHSEPITHVAISPDGKLLASAGEDNLVKLWQLDRQHPRKVRLLQTLIGHRDHVFDVSFSPNGRYLASTSQDKTIRLWPLAWNGDRLTVKPPTVLTDHRAGVHDVAFSPDSRYLAAASDDRTVRIWKLVWDAQPKQSIRRIIPKTVLLGHQKEVRSVAFHPREPLLASGSLDETIKLWQPENGTLLTTLNGHDAAVTSVAFTPEGQLLSGSRDRTMIAWNISQILSADSILADACTWVAEYLQHHPNGAPEKLSICDAFTPEETTRR